MQVLYNTMCYTCAVWSCETDSHIKSSCFQLELSGVFNPRLYVHLRACHVFRVLASYHNSYTPRPIYLPRAVQISAILIFSSVMDVASRNDINSHLRSHLLGDKTKLVIEAYIKHSGYSSKKTLPRITGHDFYFSPNQRQNLFPWLSQHVKRDGQLLLVKACREKSHFLYRMFSKTAETFVKILSALRVFCCFLKKATRRHSVSQYSTRTICTPLGFSGSALEDHIFFRSNYNGPEGPDELDQAARIHFLKDKTRKLVIHLKSCPYVLLREGFFCMSAEVLRAVHTQGLSDELLIKLTICDEELDTADTVLGLLCNNNLGGETGTVRIRCFMAEPGSDLLAIECKKLKSNDKEQLRCRCDGSKLRKVTSGKDFVVWEPQSTAQLCSQCEFKLVPKGYDEFHKHVNELLSTVSPSIHEKNIAESDFLLKNPDCEDEQTNNDLDDDIRMLQAVLSKVSAVSDVLTLSVIRANISILLLLLVLFLPIIVIVSITSIRKHAEIIAVGVAYIPAMLTSLAALVSIAPEKVFARWKNMFYRKVKTFKDLKSLLGLHKYTNQQWREALLNMDHGSFNLYPFGSVYKVNRYQDSKYLSLSD